jgi:hypothetical protein
MRSCSGFDGDQQNATRRVSVTTPSALRGAAWMRLASTWSTRCPFHVDHFESTVAALEDIADAAKDRVRGHAQDIHQRRPIEASSSIGRAMTLAMASGWVKAKRFGTSSPRMSETYVSRITMRLKARVSAYGQDRNLLERDGAAARTRRAAETPRRPVYRLVLTVSSGEVGTVDLGHQFR